MKIHLKKKYIAIIIFIMGLLMFFYPIVSSYLAEKNQVAVIDSYDNNIKSKSDDYFKKEKDKAIEYNNSLIGDPVKDPFVFDSGYALPDNYKQVLNINGTMGYIEIPKIKVKLPIYHGSTEESLSKGVGHIESTSLPIGGESSHSVLTGHRGLPNAKMFTDLNLLNIGDHFYITYLNETIAYEVDKIVVVKPNDLSSLVIENGEDYISLITCTPYGINTHRLIIRGKRVEYVKDEIYNETTSIKEKFLSNSYQIIGIIIGLLILIIGFNINKLYDKYKGFVKVDRKDDKKVINNNHMYDVIKQEYKNYENNHDVEEIEMLSMDEKIEKSKDIVVEYKEENVDDYFTWEEDEIENLYETIVEESNEENVDDYFTWEEDEIENLCETIVEEYKEETLDDYFTWEEDEIDIIVNNDNHELKTVNNNNLKNNNNSRKTNNAGYKNKKKNTNSNNKKNIKKQVNNSKSNLSYKNNKKKPKKENR